MRYTTLLLLLTMTPSFTNAQKQDDVLIENLLKQHPDWFENILQHQDRYEVQIIYTQINRDKKNVPSFKTYSYQADAKHYFYPASTVKFPSSLLALEKINNLKIKGLTKKSTFLTEATFSGHTPVTQDSTSETGKPSIEHYIKKILLVSDNDAHNRLYEFLGQQYINEQLHAKGYTNVRLTHRLQTGNTFEENRRTNPVKFYDGEQLVYEQPMITNEKVFKPESSIKKGIGYYQNNKLVNEPFDFTDRNYFALEEQQKMLRAVLFPESVAPKLRFNLTKDDYRFLYQYMSELPTESKSPKYDSTTFYPSYCKFLMYGSEKSAVIPKNIRLFGKIGDAYGFLIDNSYIVDFDKGVEFMLSAVIHVNEDGIFNDDKYEYDTVGFPFMKHLGQTVYDFECKRPKKVKPDLSKFKIGY